MKIAKSQTPTRRIIRHIKPRRRLHETVIVEKVEEVSPEQEKIEENTGGFFALTEIHNKNQISPNRRNIIDLPPVKIAPKKSNENMDFSDLSPKYIIEKINESVKNGEKVRFKGIGLESTEYYKKYLENQQEKEKHEKNKQLAEQYFKSIRNIRRPNEHVQSFNRIKAQLNKLAERKNKSFVVVLENNMDSAFQRMDRELNRGTAYAKYSPDFP